MTVTQEATNHHVPSRSTLSEIELLRLKVAHLTLELALAQAQANVQRLEQIRAALIRQTLLNHVRAEDVDGYGIDLDAGTILPHQQRSPHGE